jgi:hypothetical protein
MSEKDKHLLTVPDFFVDSITICAYNLYISYRFNRNYTLIKSGGGTGPMKPGNQHDSFACMVPNPAVKTGR